MRQDSLIWAEIARRCQSASFFLKGQEVKSDENQPPGRLHGSFDGVRGSTKGEKDSAEHPIDSTHVPKSHTWTWTPILDSIRKSCCDGAAYDRIGLPPEWGGLEAGQICAELQVCST